MVESALSIGELARTAGTKVVTIRYYEKIGLLPSPPRSASNYRVYTKDHGMRLRFIRRCRDLGFTIDQVRDLLQLSSRRNEVCTGVDRLAAEHLASIESKLEDLKRLAAELRRLNRCCEGGVAIADCRIIEALSH